jgi:hypothetical protein
MRRLAALLLLGTAPALAQTPLPPLTPRTPTGFSTIEQRYVYATPDEGTMEFPVRTGGIASHEIAIEEPSMCAPDAGGEVRIDYSKSNNTVRFRAEFRGLPYRMDYSWGRDVSTPYNQYPVSIEDGKWQVWLVDQMFNRPSIFWYDGLTGILIGNEYDVDEGSLPPSAFPVVLNTLHMICLNMPFESDPDTLQANLDITIPYDQMLDAAGTGGVLFTLIPPNLCQPDQLIPYYTNGGLPPEEAVSFDELLLGVNQGYGTAIALSLEPDPKPDYLHARDNIMIGYGGSYPQSIPQEIVGDPRTGAFKLRDKCETHEGGGWGEPYYDFCVPPSP